MLSKPALGSKLLAEFVGTFTLIGVGVSAGINMADAGGIGLLAVALAHGLAIAVMVTAIGHISGGHLNPAVTIGIAAMRKIAPGEAVAYIIAQLAGAVVATLLVKSAFPGSTEAFDGLVAPALGSGISVGTGMLLEAVATFLLVWTVFAVAVDRDGAFFKVSGLPIGFAVAMGILMIGPATGAALNPARWFGPALVTGTWGDAVVWIVGPIVGGVVAGAAYIYGIRPRLEDKA